MGWRQRNYAVRVDGGYSVTIRYLVFLSRCNRERGIADRLLSYSAKYGPIAVQGVLDTLGGSRVVAMGPNANNTTLTLPPRGVSLCQVYSIMSPRTVSGVVKVRRSPSPFYPINQGVNGILKGACSALGGGLVIDVGAVALRRVLTSCRRILTRRGGGGD